MESRGAGELDHRPVALDRDPTCDRSAPRPRHRHVERVEAGRLERVHRAFAAVGDRQLHDVERRARLTQSRGEGSGSRGAR
ncbi:MAG: hypothetical protein QM747_02590 [Nocardioides sp.]